MKRFYAAIVAVLFCFSIKAAVAYATISCYEFAGASSSTSCGKTKTYSGGDSSWSATSSAWSNTDLGVNHIYGTAGAFVVENNDTFLNSYGASAKAESKWDDAITITSNSLAKNTPVDIQTTFYLDALADSSSQGEWEGGGWSEGANVEVAGYVASAPSQPGWAGPYSEDWDSSSEDVFEAYNDAITIGYSGNPATSLIINSIGYVGETSDIGVDLSGEADASAGWYINPYTGATLFDSSSNATIDASDTALYGINILTPGASYTSGSGFVYPTNAVNTPEPSTLPLLGAGIMALAALRGIGVGKKADRLLR